MADAHSKSRSQTKSRPYVLQTVHLSTTQAHQVYKRTFAQLSKATFNIEVITPVVLDDQAADRADVTVNDHLDGLARELSQEIKRLDQLMEDNGILQPASYDRVEVVEARIESPRAQQFLNLIKQTDELIAKLDALWIAQILDRKQRVEGAHHWKKRVQRVARQIIGLETQLRAEGRRRGQDTDTAIQAAGGDVSQSPGLADGEPEELEEGSEEAETESDSEQPAAEASGPLDRLMGRFSGAGAS